MKSKSKRQSQPGIRISFSLQQYWMWLLLASPRAHLGAGGCQGSCLIESLISRAQLCSYRKSETSQPLPGQISTRCNQHVCVLSHYNLVRLFATPWTVAHQASLSMGFFRQGYWSGLSCPSPRDLPDPGIKSGSPALRTDSLLNEFPSPPIY